MKTATLHHFSQTHHASLWDLLAIFFHVERDHSQEKLVVTEKSAAPDPLSEIQFFEDEAEMIHYLQSFRD